MISFFSSFFSLFPSLFGHHSLLAYSIGSKIAQQHKAKRRKVYICNAKTKGNGIQQYEWTGNQIRIEKRKR